MMKKFPAAEARNTTALIIPVAFKTESAVAKMMRIAVREVATMKKLLTATMR
jgi:hypothetical protein